MFFDPTMTVMPSTICSQLSDRYPDVNSTSVFTVSIRSLVYFRVSVYE